MIRSKKITRSSRGKPCSLNIVGVCNYNEETTVFAHLPSQSHGIGLKSTDICGCDACSACHDVLDGRVQSDEWKHHSGFYMLRGLVRTLERLLDEGILCIK